jgi:hypothetical protein
MLPVADRLRALAGPSRFDIRTSRVVVVRREWTGGRRGAAAPVGQQRYRDTRLELPQTAAVRQLSTGEVASSGGRLEHGDLRVRPITPAYERPDGSRGGFSEADLKPVDRMGLETFYLIEGAHAGEYQLVALESTKAFSYALILRRRATTP